MPRFSFNRSSFLGGELSGRVDGRVDLQQYNFGLKQCRNFVVLPSGGVTRRPGTVYVDDVRGGSSDAVTRARLIPFVVSEDQSYVIVLWNNSVSGNTEVRVIDSETHAAQSVTSYLTLDYSDDELKAIQFAQAGDLLVMVVDGREPVTIWRTGAGFFVDDYLLGSYPLAGSTYLRSPYIQNLGSLTITPSAISGAITLTASTSYFGPEFVGTFMRIYSGSNQGYAQIVSYVSPTVVNALVVITFGSTAATTDWAIQEFSSHRGYPRSVCFYNQRLIFGGTTFRPDTFWASQVGDYFQFEPITGLVADAQSFTLVSSKNNRIQWMDGGKKHTLGTIGGEWVGEFREDGTNLFLEYKQETMHGSAYVQPAKIANTLQFVQMSRRRVRELVYNNDEGGYVANDLNLLKDDIAEDSRIDGIANVDSPTHIFWCFSQDGYLFGATRERGQQIIAWHSHQIGGRFDTGVDYANAVVESLCATPQDGGRYDTIWMVVQRTINGAQKWYLEKMDQFRYMDRQEFLGTDPADWFYFVDSAKGVYSMAAANVFSGFSHLAGEEVEVMADGKYVGPVTVSGGGQITLPSSLTANRVVAGFKYKSRIKTMRQEGGSAIGSSVGAIRRPDRLSLNIYKSRFFKVGFESPESKTRVIDAGSDDATQTDFHDQYCKEIAFVDPGEIMADPYWTNSWIQTVAVPAGYDDKAIAIVLVDKPYPCTVLSLTTRILESDI